MRSLLANQVLSLIMEERIKTTVVKAKESRRLAERLVTLAKKGTLHHRRRAISLLRPNTRVRDRIDGGYIPVTAKQKAVRKLFDILGPRFMNRPGGYTRIIRLGQRQGDGADMCLLEFVEADMKPRRRATKGRVAAAEPALVGEESAAESAAPAESAAGEAEAVAVSGEAAAKEAAPSQAAPDMEVGEAPASEAAEAPESDDKK